MLAPSAPSEQVQRLCLGGLPAALLAASIPKLTARQ